MTDQFEDQLGYTPFSPSLSNIRHFEYCEPLRTEPIRAQVPTEESIVRMKKRMMIMESQSSYNMPRPMRDTIDGLLAKYYGRGPTIVSVALPDGAALDTVGPTLVAGLFASVVEGDFSMATSLLRMGAHVDGCKGEGLTPLLLAAGAGDIRMTDFLLAAGANVEHTDNDGLTALLVAVRYNQTRACQKLLKNEYTKANINSRDYKERNVVHLAIYFGCSHDLLRLLLSNGADPNAQDVEGRTPLHYCIDFDTKSAAHELLKKVNPENFPIEQGESDGCKWFECGLCQKRLERSCDVR